jgi:hypothetical protein
VRGVIHRVIDDLVTRFEYRVAQFRDWRRYNSAVEQGLIVVPAVAVLAALGALTAVALTRPGSGNVSFLQSNAASVSPAGPSTAPVDVVTRRPATGGNAVIRTVSGRGTTVEGLVRLPGQTVREVQTFTTQQGEVQTLTTQQIATVTDVQSVTVTAPPVTVTAPPVTVTVVETVKCNPKDC